MKEVEKEVQYNSILRIRSESAKSSQSLVEGIYIDILFNKVLYNILCPLLTNGEKSRHLM